MAQRRVSRGCRSSTNRFRASAAGNDLFREQRADPVGERALLVEHRRQLALDVARELDLLGAALQPDS